MKKSKYLALILFLFIGAASCSTLPYLILKFQDRKYVLCSDEEMDSPVGKACFRYCARYKRWRAHIPSNCVIWKTDVLDLSKREDFTKLRDAGFILINEERRG